MNPRSNPSGGGKILRRVATDARAALGLRAKNDPEILRRLEKLARRGEVPGVFAFPWGRFEYYSPGCLKAHRQK